MLHPSVIQVGARRRKDPSAQKRKLLAMIETYAECKVEDAEKGGADPAFVPLIEANLAGSKRALLEFIDRLLEERI
jgi:hypothetical protein